MINCPVVKVEVTTNKRTKVVKSVCAHEVPIFVMDFGKTGVHVSDPYCGAKEVDETIEHAALTRRHPRIENGQTSVVAVYGQDFESRLADAMGRGLSILGIEPEQVEEPDEMEPPKRKTRKKRTAKKVAEDGASDDSDII